jgi:hypothetical protein
MPRRHFAARDIRTMAGYLRRHMRPRCFAESRHDIAALRLAALHCLLLYAFREYEVTLPLFRCQTALYGTQSRLFNIVGYATAEASIPRAPFILPPPATYMKHCFAPNAQPPFIFRRHRSMLMMISPSAASRRLRRLYAVAHAVHGQHAATVTPAFSRTDLITTSHHVTSHTSSRCCSPIDRAPFVYCPYQRHQQ